MLRGTILDRNERTLAMSLTVKTLYADPSEIKDTMPRQKASRAVLKLDANQVAAQLRQGKEANKRFIPCKKTRRSRCSKDKQGLGYPEIKKPDLPNFEGLHWRTIRDAATHIRHWRPK